MAHFKRPMVAGDNRLMPTDWHAGQPDMPSGWSMRASASKGARLSTGRPSEPGNGIFQLGCKRCLEQAPGL
jgi:hypothetical protein